MYLILLWGRWKSLSVHKSVLHGPLPHWNKHIPRCSPSRQHRRHWYWCSTGFGCGATRICAFTGKAGLGAAGMEDMEVRINAWYTMSSVFLRWFGNPDHSYHMILIAIIYYHYELPENLRNASVRCCPNVAWTRVRDGHPSLRILRHSKQASLVWLHFVHLQIKCFDHSNVTHFIALLGWILNVQNLDWARKTPSHMFDICFEFAQVETRRALHLQIDCFSVFWHGLLFAYRIGSRFVLVVLFSASKCSNSQPILERISLKPKLTVPIPTLDRCRRLVEGGTLFLHGTIVRCVLPRCQASLDQVSGALQLEGIMHLTLPWSWRRFGGLGRWIYRR